MAACGGASVQAVVGSVSVGEVALSSHPDKSNGMSESTAPERAIGPSGDAPRLRIEHVASVEDPLLAHNRC